MSETTTSVPLKTAEGAAHQLLIALRTIAAYPVTNLLMNMDAANMQRIAVRALEAQAAPAAVAIQGAVKLLRNEAARLERLYGRRGWYGFGDEKAAHIEHLRVAEALAATPARPATEDSSAGDLAEVQAEPVAVTTRAELQKLQARGVGSPVGTMFHPAAEGFPVKLYTAPQAQPADALDADQSEPADLWYLQDTRGYVGNDVLWWAKDGNGYTTDISKAHAYTRDEAFQQAMRGTDRAWPKAYIDGKTRPAVDMQYIDHQAAMAAAQEGGNAAKEA